VPVRFFGLMETDIYLYVEPYSEMFSFLGSPRPATFQTSAGTLLWFDGDMQNRIRESKYLGRPVLNLEQGPFDFRGLNILYSLSRFGKFRC
jgi:hypothetical protein